MTIKMNYRMPTTAFGYVELEVSGENSAAVEADVASMQKLFGASIQIAGGGDSATAAERLLSEQLGAVRINEDGSPWEKPQVHASQPWDNTPTPVTADPLASSFGAPVESSGPAPFGAPDPFAAPPRDTFFIDVPNGGLDAWKELRKTLNGSLPKGTIDWDADAKRNTIKKSAPQNILDGLRQRGYILR